MRDSDPFKYASASMYASPARIGSNQFMQEMRVRSVSHLLRSSSGIVGNRKSRLSGSLAIRVIGGYVACVHVLATKAQAACGTRDAMW